MTAPPQQQLTSNDHHYFDWSISKQPKIIEEQPQLVHSLTHSNRKNCYQYYDDNQLKQNNTVYTTPLISSQTDKTVNGHIRKKQKLNTIGSTSSFNINDEPTQSQQTCYPFQAELTQKIDIECGSSNNSLGQSTHTPTHHFTLSTVINVSVNGQTQKSLDIVPSSSQESCSIKSTEQQDYHNQSPSPLTSVSLMPYSELNLPLYLKDIDLQTFDTFILPSCPNPQDYLTIDGLLTFLTSDKNFLNESNKYSQLRQQTHNYSRIQNNRYPYQQYPTSQNYNYPQQNSSSITMTNPCTPTTATTMETGNFSYYRQSSLPQQMTRYYSNSTPTPTFR